ncbi:MAG: PQQ-dependent sugar dehydrogenase [Actinobacteria bacterium]|nr:PQQ-dependent sugar dehydrogenase [Actinomycetota bacterium]
MRLAVALVFGAAAVLVTGAASAHEQGLHLVRVAHFTAPIYATAAPGQPEKLYVVEQTGRIMVLQGGHIRAAPFFDIRSLVKSGGELGLLSVAFAPDYATSHRFYVDYTDLNGDTRVVQYRSNGTSAILSSAKQLLFVKDFASNHNGGQLQFGPDGRLYWGNGDGGGAGDPEHNGQSLARPFAKIMRLNINVAAPRWQLVAYGLRNPWRFSFDRATGDLYIGDVGQDHWEEVDYLRKGSGVANFGWNHFEASHVYDASTTVLTKGIYHGPLAEYSHSDGCSVTGGYVYRGSQIAAVQGRYFYGDYCSGSIWSLRVAGGQATTVRLEPFKVAGLSSFGQDSAGELYTMSVDSGNLYRLAG